MRRTSLIFAVTLSAATCGWFLRGVQSPQIPEVTPVGHHVVAPSADPEIEGIAHPFLRPAPGSGSGRNLFAYVASAPSPQPRRSDSAPAIALPPPLPEVRTVAVEEPPQPRFLHRFIGRFGPAVNPVAALARDGEILTVQRGDRVGAFAVRSIEADAIVVGVGDGSLRTMRIALSE